MNIEHNLKDPSSIYYLGPEYERLLDFRGQDTATINKERIDRLTDFHNHYYSYMYAALFLKQVKVQWEKEGYPIDKRPEILATLFNVGYPQSKPKPNPRVGGSTIKIYEKPYSFGAIAYQFYYSGELFDLFPFEVWAKLNAAFWRKPDLQQLCYGDPAGDARLRGMIAAYLRSSRGMQCTAEQIVITSGAQQGISLCAQLLVESGDGVAIENPGYRAAGHAFAVAGARLQGVAVDSEGIDCNALATYSHCRLAYVTPSHQYPTGVVMSLARRLELLAWAERNQGWIVEDDYDGEYRYTGAPLAPLAALDRQGRVLYVGTFGKVAFPALRLGYLVLPPGLVDAFSRRRAVDVRHSEVSTQAVMAEFMAAGHFQRHIRRMRRAALSRRNTLMADWPQGICGVGQLPSVAAGLHLTVAVDTAAREQELIEKAARVDVEINPLSSYWLPDSQTPLDQRAGLVLGFAAVPEADIRAALARLNKAWR